MRQTGNLVIALCASELLRNAEDLADYEYGTVSEAGALRHLAPGSRKSMNSLREMVLGCFGDILKNMRCVLHHLGTCVMPFSFFIYSSFCKQCFRFMMTERHDLSASAGCAHVDCWKMGRAEQMGLKVCSHGHCWLQGAIYKPHSQTGDYPMGWTRRGQWTKFLSPHSFSFKFPGMRASKTAKTRCSQGP